MANQIQPQQPTQLQPTQTISPPTQPQPTQTQPPPTQTTPPIQNQPVQPQPLQTQPKKKSCLVPCLIAFGVFVLLCVIGWFLLRPMFFKWLCRKGSQEQGLIKLDEGTYYNMCLRKYHIID